MKNFLKEFEEVISSGAFSELGDLESSGEMVTRSKTSNKKVLLATDTESVHGGVIRHALNLCRRMGGKLEILHLATSRPRGEKEEIEQHDMPKALNGLATSYTRKISGDSFENEVVGYTANRRDLLCVVLDTAECRKTGNNRTCEKYLSGLVEKITCPVVIYTGFLEV